MAKGILATIGSFFSNKDEDEKRFALPKPSFFGAANTRGGKGGFGYENILKPLATAQEFVQGSKSFALPKFKTETNLSKPQTFQAPNVLKTGANMGIDLVNSIAGFAANTGSDVGRAIMTGAGRDSLNYQTAKSPATRLGMQLGSFINPASGKQFKVDTRPQQIIGNVAGSLVPIADAYTGGKAKTLLTASKPILLNRIARGVRETAPIAGAGGALYGLSESRNENLGNQLLSGAVGGAGGLLIGGGLGIAGPIAGSTSRGLLKGVQGADNILRRNNFDTYARRVIDDIRATPGLSDAMRADIRANAQTGAASRLKIQFRELGMPDSFQKLSAIETVKVGEFLTGLRDELPESITRRVSDDLPKMSWREIGQGARESFGSESGSADVDLLTLGMGSRLEKRLNKRPTIETPEQLADALRQNSQVQKSIEAGKPITMKRDDILKWVGDRYQLSQELFENLTDPNRTGPMDITGGGTLLSAKGRGANKELMDTLLIDLPKQPNVPTPPTIAPTSKTRAVQLNRTAKIDEPTVDATPSQRNIKPEDAEMLDEIGRERERVINEFIDNELIPNAKLGVNQGYLIRNRVPGDPLENEVIGRVGRTSENHPWYSQALKDLGKTRLSRRDYRELAERFLREGYPTRGGLVEPDADYLALTELDNQIRQAIDSPDYNVDVNGGLNTSVVNDSPTNVSAYDALSGTAIAPESAPTSPSPITDPRLLLSAPVDTPSATPTYSPSRARSAFQRGTTPRGVMLNRLPAGDEAIPMGARGTNAAAPLYQPGRLVDEEDFAGNNAGFISAADDNMPSPIAYEEGRLLSEREFNRMDRADTRELASETINPYGTARMETAGIAVPPEIITGAVAGKDKPRLLLNVRSPVRVIESVFDPKTATAIKEFFLNRVVENEQAANNFIQDGENFLKGIQSKYKIKPKSQEAKDLFRFGEATDKTEAMQSLIAKYGEARANDFVEVDAAFRGYYDNLLNQVNEAIGKFGYDPVPKRANYYTHAQDLGDILNRFGGITREDQLPPGIAGLTADFHPGKEFFSFGQQREGGTNYVEDPFFSLDVYLRSAANQVYHTDSIQRGRALTRVLRDTLEKDNQNFSLSNGFLPWLQAYTDVLAGKKALLSRGTEDFAGRQSFGIVDLLRRQTSANMVGGNIGAAISNLIPSLTQVPATTSKSSWIRGMARAVVQPLTEANDYTIDGIQSSFLRRRFAPNKQYMSWWESAGKKANWLFETVDRFSSTTTVLSKYNELIRQGVPKEQAMRQADDYASRLMGDRSKGQMPYIFNNQGIANLLTQFQLEIANQLDYLATDVPKEKGFNKAAIAAAWGQVALYGWLYNAAQEKLTGNRPALDPVGTAMTVASTWQDDEQTMADKLMKTTEAVGNNLPFASFFLGGGRVPAFSIFGDTQKWVNDPMGAARKLLLMGLPAGGGQVNKTWEGLRDFNQGYTTTPSDLIKYPINQTPGNLFRGALFGRNSFPEAQAYYDEGNQALGKEQTQAFLSMSPDTRDDYYNFVQAERNLTQAQTRIAEEMGAGSLTAAQGQQQMDEALRAFQNDTAGLVFDSSIASGATGQAAPLTDQSPIDLTSRDSLFNRMAESGAFTRTKKGKKIAAKSPKIKAVKLPTKSRRLDEGIITAPDSTITLPPITLPKRQPILVKTRDPKTRRVRV